MQINCCCCWRINVDDPKLPFCYLSYSLCLYTHPKKNKSISYIGKKDVKRYLRSYLLQFSVEKCISGVQLISLESTLSVCETKMNKVYIRNEQKSLHEQSKRIKDIIKVY